MNKFFRMNYMAFSYGPISSWGRSITDPLSAYYSRSWSGGWLPPSYMLRSWDFGRGFSQKDGFSGAMGSSEAGFCGTAWSAAMNDMANGVSGTFIPPPPSVIGFGIS